MSDELHLSPLQEWHSTVSVLLSMKLVISVLAISQNDVLNISGWQFRVIAFIFPSFDSIKNKNNKIPQIYSPEHFVTCIIVNVFSNNSLIVTLTQDQST